MPFMRKRLHPDAHYRVIRLAWLPHSSSSSNSSVVSMSRPCTPRHTKFWDGRFRHVGLGDVGHMSPRPCRWNAADQLAVSGDLSARVGRCSLELLFIDPTPKLRF